MQNKIFLTVMLSVILALGLTGCPQEAENNDPKSIRITHIPSNVSIAWVGVFSKLDISSQDIINLNHSTLDHTNLPEGLMAVGPSFYTYGTELTLALFSAKDSTKNWTGSGYYYVLLLDNTAPPSTKSYVYTDGGELDYEDTDVLQKSMKKLGFNSKSVSVEYSKFKQVFTEDLP